MAKRLHLAIPAGPTRVAWWVPAGLLGIRALGNPALAADTRHDCMLWNRSGGAERVELGNRIGASNLLTKRHRLASAEPGDSQSLYSTVDLRRHCDPR